jgi:hypothetical protein
LHRKFEKMKERKEVKCEIGKSALGLEIVTR